MKKELVLLLLLAFAGGCSESQTTNGGSSKSAAPTATEIQASAANSQHENHNEKYSLDATVKETEKGYYLTVKTNLRLSPQHYNGSHEEGEGHVHLYVNGTLIGPIQSTDPYLLPELQKGDNQIKLVLATNSHNESEYEQTKELVVSVT